MSDPRQEPTLKLPGEPEASAREFLVTVTAGNRPRRFVWDPERSLPLNHPTTLHLEHSGNTVRVVRDDVVLQSLIVPKTDIGLSRELSVEHLKIKIAPLRRPRAAYLPASAVFMSSSADPLFFSAGYEESFYQFGPLARSWVARLGNRKVLRFKRKENGVLVEALVDGVTYGGSETKGSRAGDETPAVTKKLTPRTPLLLTDFRKTAYAFFLDGYWWRIFTTPAPAIPGVEVDNFLRNDKETKLFEKARNVPFAVFAVFVLAVWTRLVHEPQEAPPPKPETVVQIRKVTPKPTPTQTPAPKKETPPPKEPPKKEPPKNEPPKKKEAPKKQTPPKKPAPKPKAPPAPAPAPKANVPKPAPAAPAPKKKVITPPTTGTRPPDPRQAAAAAATARLNKSLGFLSAGPKVIASRNLAPSNVKSQYTRYQAINDAATAAGKAGGGSNVLNKIASSVGGSGNSAIATKGARGMGASTGVEGGYGAGGRGKGLNEVQGRVSMAALYDPDAGEGMGSGLGGGGLTMSGQGKISESLLKKVLEKHMQKFQFCYEKALLTNASLAGNLLMQWTIQPGGAASSVKVVRSQLNNAKLHQCVSTELGRIQFPSPQGGAVVVNFPFAFSSSSL